MSRICDLPEETLSEILIRLPVKSIGKSRCVSKHWNSLLTSPQFIKTHLARSHHKQKNLLLLRRDCHSRRSLLFNFTLRPDGGAEGTFENRGSIPTLDKYFVLVGHCNGLVVIGTKDNDGLSLNPDYLLMNSTTLEHSRLPQPPPSFSLVHSSQALLGSKYGFGYDSSSDDYKVVNLLVVVSRRGGFITTELCHFFADVYSVKNKLWRRVNIDYRPFRNHTACNCDHGAGVLFNGALHWLSDYPDHSIHAFDLATEKCYEISSLPSRIWQSDYNILLGNLIVTNGGSCLGIASWARNEARIDIWAMSKYGIAESWTKNVYLDFGTTPDMARVPMFCRDAPVFQHHRNRGALLRGHPYKLTFYPYNDEKYFGMTLDTTTLPKDLRGDGLFLDDGWIYSESLVSPHQTQP